MPSAYSVTAAQVGDARQPASTRLITAAETPGMSPSSSMMASQSPAASSPARSEEAQPVPYSSLPTTAARPGRRDLAASVALPPSTSTTRSSRESSTSRTTYARSEPSPNGS